MLYNKEKQRVEIFFDIAQRLARNFKSSHPIKSFKTLKTDENFLIAVNETKGLVAIYNTRKDEVSLKYAFGNFINL